MPFALNTNPSQSEISDAINYLLANFGPNLAADPNNGQISGPSGVIIAYLYKYIAVKYADSFDGSLNFSNSPTGRTYYGLRNTNDSVESSNPADYIWYQAAGGFGTTKFLFYQTIGGRQVNFFVGTAAPDSTYLQESGSSIDLDVVTTTTAYNTAAPSIYYWTTTSTPPARPSTTSTYTWSTGAYTAPSGWATTPPVNTTAGSYLWAITIPLIVNANTVSSTLDWTNTAYAIYVLSSNGSTGSTGGNGLSALTAYRAQLQTDTAPATPSNTTGATAPSGWSLTAPSVSVGSVLWYTFGQYNSSSTTINGIPAGQTQWGTPTAASVFQDLQSNNWNGSTPPVYGTPTTYGTLGYYIRQGSTVGNPSAIYINNGIFSGVVQSGTTGNRVVLNESSSAYFKIYDSSGNVIYSLLGVAGLYTNSTLVGASAVSAFSVTNAVGYGGTAITATSLGSGHGVVGQSNDTGTNRNGVLGTNSGTGSAAAAVYGNNSASYGLYSNGQMGISNTTMVTNLNSEFSNKLLGSVSNTFRFVKGTITGASVASFISTNKPGTTSTSNVWLEVTIDSTTVFIPVWT